MRNAKVRILGEPLGQVLPDARVEPHFACIDKRHDRRRSELFRDGAERKYRRCIGRLTASSRRAVTPLQDYRIAAKDRDVRCRNALLRDERTRRGVGCGDIRLGHRRLGEADSSRMERAIAVLMQATP